MKDIKTTIDYLKSNDESENEYVSIKTYADMYNISPLLLLEDIIEGKYQSAICLIRKDEECKSSFSEKSRPKGTVSRSPDYILVKEYAAIHGITVSTMMKKIHQGKYKTAIKESNRWYIHKDDEEITLIKGYVTAKEYADIHGLKYSTILRDLSLGLYNTAYQDESRHWFLNENDQKQEPYISDEFEGYIPAKEYAEKNEIHYNVLLENIRNGLYDGNIKKKDDRYWYIREDAKCVTGNHVVKGYISIEKYAFNNKADLDILYSDVENGKYKTAKQIDGFWYLKPQEKCKSFSGEDYISVTAYAKLHGVSRSKIADDIEKGVYTTVTRKGNRTYIKKDEDFKSVDRRKGKRTPAPQEPQYISVSEYAKRHSFSYLKILEDVKNGVYDSAYQKGTRWLIDADEPCKSVDKRKKKNYIRISEYAKIHEISYQKMLSDVKLGIYLTAEQRNSRWFIDESEPVKSVDRRKKKK